MSQIKRIGVIILVSICAIGALFFGYQYFKANTPSANRELTLTKISDIYIPEGEPEGEVTRPHLQQTKSGISFLNRQEEINLYEPKKDLQNLGGYGTDIYRISPAGNYLNVNKGRSNAVYKLPSDFINSLDAEMLFWVSDTTYAALNEQPGTSTLQVYSVSGDKLEAIPAPKETANAQPIGQNVLVQSHEHDGVGDISLLTPAGKSLLSMEEVTIRAINSNMESIIVAQGNTLIEIDSSGKETELSGVGSDKRVALLGRNLYIARIIKGGTAYSVIDLDSKKETQLGKVSAKGFVSTMYALPGRLIVEYDYSLWETKI